MEYDRYWELTKTLPNEESQRVISEFLLSFKLANRSSETIRHYRNFLEHFFCDQNESCLSLSPAEILQWFTQHQGHVKESTLYKRLSILSSFYNFCVQEEYLERSPMKSRWFPRLPQPIPKYLEKREIAKTRQQSEKTTIRNQAILEFMLTSGCRVGEVHQLNRADVDLENRTARVVGKGKKIRNVHFSEKCAVLMERYLATHNREAFFISRTGKRLGIRRIQSVIKKIGEGADISSSLHPHRFRHTFATELLAKGAELSFIADELGHSSISTTQIYARLPQNEIIALYRKYMG